MCISRFRGAACGDVISIPRFLPIVLLLAVLSAISPSRAEALSVYVDPGAYSGPWFASTSPSPPGNHTGAQTLDFATGSNFVYVGSYGAIEFFLAGDGTVTVAGGNDAATGGASTLTFQNSSLSVNPSLFTGDWLINGVTGTLNGPQTLVIVPGLRYGIDIGQVGGRMFVTVAADGQVTVENGVSGVGGPGSLVLNTVLVNVDPGLYEGKWELFGGIRAYASGPDLVTLVPGIGPYGIRPGLGLNPSFYASVVPFTVDGVGNVTVTGGAATGGAASLTLKTVPLSVEPGAFAGAWAIDETLIRSPAAGPAVVHLPPDLRYVIHPGNIGTGRFLIDIDPVGEVTVVNGISADGGPNSLTFRTTHVLLDATGFSGPAWNIDQVTPFQSGSASLALVPGVGYLLHDGIGNGYVFQVAEPCAIDPSEIATPVGPIVLGCGLPDADDDGVPDATDNCPAIVNADQMDRDDDGLGDLCDADLDGDGWNNEVDNCPNVANTDQADQDNDGVGNACDTDLDGDGIQDGADNCPSISNTDQADSDGDLVGDVCDADDDNDGIVDSADNCPLAVNIDQADFDADGQGDACDGDADGDLVADEVDACPQSSLGLPIDASGCSGAQRITLDCPRMSFVKHGAYVSCVAHAANEAANAGLISETEKSGFVKDAAKKE